MVLIWYWYRNISRVWFGQRKLELGPKTTVQGRNSLFLLKFSLHQVYTCLSVSCGFIVTAIWFSNPADFAYLDCVALATAPSENCFAFVIVT